MTDAYRHPDAIADTEWLAGHLDDPDLRVYECTTYLHPPGEGADAPYTVVPGRADFDAGHIPGAGFLDIQGELSDGSSPSHLRFTMPAPDVLAGTLGRRGIGDASRVVLYSRGAMQWATRVWWMLRVIGFDRAAVLDGGFEKWQAEGHPVSTEPDRYPPATLTARTRPGLFVGRDEMHAAIGDVATCTINALAPDLHRGENPRYGRPGRIPGSVNVPAASLLETPAGPLKPPAETASAFRAVGADPDRRNLVYCGGGIAATLDAFVLWQLGHEDIAVYDASMSEWARDESLPIETG